MASFGLDEQQIQDMLQELQSMSAEDRAAVLEDGKRDVEDGHLVEYAAECVREYRDTMKDRLDRDELLWEAHESIMRENRQKDAYQSKIATNEPFTTVYQAKTLVRRAVMDRPEYFSVESKIPGDQESVAYAKFKEDALRFWTSTPEANVSVLYPDMTDMAFAVGVSLAIKARWYTDQHGLDHLKLVPIEPWKIARDIDAKPRQPQSGMYCVHEDFVDYHVLLEGEKEGRYKNVRDVREGREREAGTTKEEDARRKGQIAQRNKFRKSILVQEFWGDVLDHNGELVLPNVSYTVANGVVIRDPFRVPFLRHRWPIHQFAALPHILNFHGYGLYEGVLVIWKLRNNLLNMTLDNENFRTNQMFEVDPSKLENPADTELYPGVQKIRKAGVEGQAYRPIQVTSELTNFKLLWAVSDDLFENGSFVNKFVKGQQDTDEAKRTATELTLKTQQSLGVFDGIGRDVEGGGVQLLELVDDVTTTYWDDFQGERFKGLFQKHPSAHQRLDATKMMMPRQRMKRMDLDSKIQIHGVSQLFEKSEELQRLNNWVMVTNSPRFAKYSKDGAAIKKIAEALKATTLCKTEQEVQQEEAAALELQQRQGHQEGVLAAVQQAKGKVDEVLGREDMAASAGGPTAQPTY